jgi:thiol-disulfide isomerase/thioredoxin
MAGTSEERSAGSNPTLGVEVAATEERPGIPVTLVDYEGFQKVVAAHRGKVVVVDCWATWCAPCLEELPHLVELRRAHDAEKLACITLSFDYDGLGRPEELLAGAETVLTRIGTTATGFENVMGSEEAEAMYKKLDFPSVPAVLVYSQAGELVRKLHGSRVDYAEVKKLVGELLETPGS